MCDPVWRTLWKSWEYIGIGRQPGRWGSHHVARRPGAGSRMLRSRLAGVLNRRGVPEQVLQDTMPQIAQDRRVSSRAAVCSNQAEILRLGVWKYRPNLLGIQSPQSRKQSSEQATVVTQHGVIAVLIERGRR